MIREVQYLRGIAAMMVVWFHAVSQIDATQQYVHVYKFGQHGVDLFFVISGFIMLVTTWAKPIGPVQFMKLRIRRIVPLYWLATLLMVGCAIASPLLFKSLKWDVEALVKSLLFVPYYNLSFPKDVAPLLLPGWTLNYEMFFYSLFAITLLAARNWRVPLMLGTLSVLVAAGFLFRPTSAPLLIYTSPVVMEFGLGMILGRLWVMRKHVRKEGQPVLMALGDASYSIYLTHLFTLAALKVIWVHLIPNATAASSWAFMAIGLVCSAFAGWVCYRLVEKPLLRIAKPVLIPAMTR